MDYSSVSKVMEVSVEAANKYLELGWTLLFVGQFNEDDVAGIYYSLGWKSENGEPKEPPPKYGSLV